MDPMIVALSILSVALMASGLLAKREQQDDEVLLDD